MLPKLSLAHQTMFADLVQRCLDADFDEQFSEAGRFYKATVKGRAYWYYALESPSPKRRYVGPAVDPAINERVERFRAIKADAKERRSMVRSLMAAGLPRPLPLVGDVVDALGRAGLFRLRGVLIGTAAFQGYGGYLGVRLPGAAVMTADADFAQFHSIAISIEDSIPPVTETLREIDPTFEEISELDPQAPPTRFRNRQRFEVEFLTPNRGADEYQSRPVAMPALGGAGALPLRYLDFLIREPVRSVLLHKAGVLVTIPAPQRYAVHKLIVAVKRRDDGNGRQKARKDIIQAAFLIAALHEERRSGDVGEAFLEAWDRGPKWREALAAGRARLTSEAQALLDEAVSVACELWGRDMDGLGA